MGSPLLFFDSDARILDGIRRGDEASLVKLYGAHRRAITALVTRNSGSPDDANDILQEALIVLWERVRRGTYEQTASIGTFLYATARNIWLRRLARTRRERPEDPATRDTAGDEPSRLDILISDEEQAALHAALDQLGEPCRSLLVMFYWEEATMEEIARRLGWANAATAKSKKYQCKEQLKRLFVSRTGSDEHDR